MSTPLLHRWFPFLAWPRPTPALLQGEFWAGMTVGLMLVPQGVAYAALAGMPLVTGIYASLVPALVAVLWSSSTRLGVGPTALTSLLIGASLTGMAEPGSAHWVQLAAWMALLSGLLQLLLGALRFGWLLNLVTSPVLGGFTQAAALLILASQLPALLGLRTTWGALASDPSVHHFDLRALAFGLGSLALLVLARRWRPSFPAAIVVIALAALASWAMGYADADGAVVGHLPSGLPSPYWPGWLPWDELGGLVMPVMVVTLVSFLETASSAKVEHSRGGTRWNENQDLIAHGMAKMSAGLCGSFATSASFSRSAINLYAGAKSGWATLFALLLVLATLLWLTPALYHVPQSVLAAVVVTAVTGLIKPMSMLRLWRISRVETAIGLVTFGLTLATAPRMYWGVLVGLLMNLSHFLYQRLHPRIIEVGLHPDGSLRDRHLWQLAPLAPQVLALRMDAELDFASANALERRVADELAARPDTRHLCLFALPINRIDVTGVEAFVRLHHLLQTHGGTLHVSGLKLPVQRTLESAGALAEGPHLATYRTDAEAIAALQKAAPATA
ncbi:SulP family inorganic anion transporter [Acidovorax sp. MR-S7]|jgi:SulP family sulfate permease|uniref:SulP family inorganic anion transporter n=1 Tax=Acidovorax sp. MR-S7 TaxID=1268622 RepID=UPI00037979C2|nr:SulP family inorganic anion transporter [Acidovorax sp. MR-S7]GAD23534.1 sulphate transporter [Acidovorax sp. MR-S7]